jgi:hypothetical protein
MEDVSRETRSFIQRSSDMSERMVLIGATGMLWPAVQAWHEAGCELTLMARSRARVAAKILALGGEAPGFIEADYHDEARLGEVLREVPQPVDCVVAWVHGSAPRALDVVIEALRPARVIHVLGSAAAHPSGGTAQPLRELHATQVELYQQVVLGFSRRGNGSTRWLTHAEIAQGVLDAHGTRALMTVAGVVEPWADRP